MEQQSCDQTQEIRVRWPFMDLVKDLAVEATAGGTTGGNLARWKVPTVETLKKHVFFYPLVI